MNWHLTLIKSFFYSNYFISICAATLTYSSSKQLKLTNIPLLFYFVIFGITLVYYTKAYIIEVVHSSSNLRTQWYVKHKKNILNSQVIIISILAIFCLLLIPNIYKNLNLLSRQDIFNICCFPIVALLYYGIQNKQFSLRNFGLLKPFIIGFSWAGISLIAPLYYSNLVNAKLTHFSSEIIYLFIENMMFVSVLAIMFDIKDFDTDSNQNLKTFVVNFGTNKTINFIIIPLLLLGFGMSILQYFSELNPLIKICTNAIPFVISIIVACSLHYQKSILYYVILIDGLIFLKAITGLLV